MPDLLRFFCGLVFLSVASLSFLPAANRVLWGGSLAATEWGYWLAIAAVVPLVPSRSQSSLGRIGAVLSLGAIPLLVLPVVRANQLNDTLPAAFDSQFGASRREHARFAEEPRPQPLVFHDLLRPLPLPAIRFEQRTFATHEGETLTLDVYRPAYDDAAVPGVIVVHGGEWTSGDNSEFVALNAYLASRDHVVVAINYRLMPRWPFPAARDDVLSALAYVKVYAAELGVDPSRLVLLGRAAGGQLALLAGYTAGDPAIRGVVSLYGPTDLEFEYAHASGFGFDTRGRLERYLGGAPAKVAEQYFAASPINFVTAASPPTLLVHGLRDTLVSPDESDRLDERLRQSNVRHLLIRLPWATHKCDKSFGGPCGQIVNYAVERFLDAVTIGAPPAPAKAERRARGHEKPAPASRLARASHVSAPRDNSSSTHPR